MPKVLILESDKLVARNLSHFLQRQGYKVVWAAEPQTAIEEADYCQPDVVVMDLILGGHSGIEFLFELRSYPEWQNLPVIIFSSLPSSELAVHHTELEQLDIATHFYKPESTLAEIAEAVGRSVSAKV